MVIPEIGAEAWASTRHRVTWMVDPSRPGGVPAVARTQLRHGLFQEFHHLVRGWVVFPRIYPERFIRGVIPEGLATAFERDFSGSTPPYGQYGEEVEDWVQELLDLPATANRDHWMFQHPDGRRDIGYRAGTFIVDDKAMVASGHSSADLVLTSADEILNLAGYGN